MVRNLRDLKDRESYLREALVSIYKTSGLSVMALSKRMKMSYSTLRVFLLGDSISCRNLFRVKEWLETNI